MKTVFILFALFSGLLPARSQVVINLQLPPMGLTMKSQLWNLSLINTSPGQLRVQIEMNLTDISNNQRVLSGTTRVFDLPRGVRQIRLSEIAPITYNVITPGYNVDASPEGFLPIGNFNICFSAIKLVSDVSERLSEDCETYQIEPLSPPQLVMPEDSEYVVTTRPLFNWMPPSPANLFNNLRYDWILVEVQPTQTAADAVEQNIPVLTQQNLQSANFQFPLSMPALDSSKLYAWRVHAKNNTSPIASSEIWAFRIKRPGFDSTMIETATYYTGLKKEEEGAFVLCNGVLRFEYTNELTNPVIQVRVYNISTSVRYEVTLDSAQHTMRPGKNYVNLDLTNQSDIRNGKLYLLELINYRKERWYLKFQYRTPDHIDAN
jgi:hypothetical protein